MDEKKQAILQEIRHAVDEIDNGWCVALCNSWSGHDLSFDTTHLIRDLLSDYLEREVENG